VRVRVETPQKINEKQKELLRQFDKLSNKKEKSFFEQVSES
jgi:DnaJ-class molecular chaperone